MDNINRVYKGLHTDNSPQNQPKETYRYALNAATESIEGDDNILSFEQSNAEILNTLPTNSNILNATYIGKNTFCLFLVTDTTSIIGVVNLDKKTYTEVVNTLDLDFRLEYPIEAVYRLRRGCERTVYFTDNFNVPRYFNLDSTGEFKTEGEWDVDNFALIKTYDKIPKYERLDVLEGGSLPAGSYNFAIQYLDGDLNPTEWLNVSDTIIIFHDNDKEISYESVRGSTNAKTSYQDFGVTDKRIQLQLSNLDSSYIFYRVAIIEANSGTGLVSRVVYSKEISTKQTTYSYTGNNSATQGTEQEIALFQLDIRKAKTILQLENELILGNTQGIPVNLCKLQKAASKIKVDLATREVWLNSTKFSNNPKNPQIHHFVDNSELDSIGYMPGEIYSFGIVGVFKGGSTTPVFHIPGKPAADTVNNMSANNTLQNTTYIDNELCEGRTEYWGKDYLGNDLSNTPVRHHRFPTRAELSAKTGNNFNLKKTTITGDITNFVLKITETTPYQTLSPAELASITSIQVIYGFEGEANEYVYQLSPPGVYDPPFDIAFQDEVVVSSTKKPFYISNSFVYTSDTIGVTTGSFTVESTVDTTEVPGGTVQKNFLNLSWTPLGSPTFVTYQLPYTVGGETRQARGVIDLSQDTSIVIESSTEAIVALAGDVIEVDIDPTTGEYKEVTTQLGTYAIDITTANITIEGEYDVSEVFGVTFSNIKFPTKEQLGEELIGYYIVQNRRDEENKTVLDTGVMFPIIDSGSKFEGVGLLSPDGDNFNVSTISTSTDPTYTAENLTPAVANKYALFHPQNAFLGREYTNAEIEYNCSYQMTNAAVKQNLDIQDAQPGTSYNSERHKKRERDTDGFTLQALSRKYEAKGVASTFSAFGGAEVLGGVAGFTDFIEDKERIDYLNSLYSYSKTEGGNLKEIFNLSTDNRFAVVTSNIDMPTVETVVSGGTGFKTEPYVKNNFYKHVVTLKNNLVEPYSNYRVLPYYKASKNIQAIETGSTTVFGGDTYISPVTITSSIFSDVRNKKRSSKSGLFKVFLGILLVTATILTGGVAAIAGSIAGAVTLGAAAAVTAIGLGVTIAATGLKVEKMREVYETLYEEGLKNVVHDYITRKFFGPNPEDDSIQWFSDVVENIYLESSINMNWRMGSSGQIPDFTDSPKNYSIDFHNNRLIDKLTILDPEKDAGRLYQGFCNAELYEINKDYMRRELQKPFFHLPLEYDCCTDCPEEFKNRFAWSQQSFQEELTDNYRSFLPLNYKDMQGETGAITGLKTIRENFYVQTEDGLWSVPKNLQERVTDEIISFIGTGDKFSIPPRPIVDSASGNNAGNQHIRGSVKTPYGIVFVSENENGIYLFDGNQLKPLHNQGIRNWLKQNIDLKVLDLFQEKSQLDYSFQDNPYSKYGIGFTLGYDPKKNRIFITKKDFIINNTEIINATDLYLGFIGDNAYYIADLQGEINTLNEGETYLWEVKSYSGDTVILERDNVITNPDTAVLEHVIELLELTATPIVLDTTEASWTISYNLKNQQWESFFSYYPNLYLTSGDEFYSYNADFNSIWKHHIKGKFNSFYGQNHKSVIEYVAINSPQTRILNSVKLYTEAKKYNFDKEDYVVIDNKTFNKAVLYNSNQCTGELSLVVKQDQANSWYSNQTLLQPNEIYIEKNDKDWSLNDIRDIRINYQEPIWITKKEDLSLEPFIDKVLNTATLDFNKNWDEMQSFEDKYLVVRLIFDTFEDVNIFLNYSDFNETLLRN